MSPRVVKPRKRVVQGGRGPAQSKRQTTDLRHARLDLERQTYLTVSEAVVYLRFTRCVQPENALYQWVRDHRIPKCRRGRTVLFLRRDLDQAVQQHRHVLHEVGE